MEVSEKIKFRALSLLADGPKTRTQITYPVGNRSPEYRDKYFGWLESLCSDSYQIGHKGPASKVYCITPAGIRELERLKSHFGIGV